MSDKLERDWWRELRREIRRGKLSRAQVCALLQVKPDRLAQWLVSRNAKKANPCPYWAVELLALKVALRDLGIIIPDVEPIDEAAAEAEAQAMRAASSAPRVSPERLKERTRKPKGRAPSPERRARRKRFKI